MTEKEQGSRTDATDRILTESDSDVWVVEYNPGSGWRVAAVLPSHEAAEQYEKDLREFYTDYSEDISEEFKHGPPKTRHGGKKSPTKMYETWPPGSDGDE